MEAETRAGDGAEPQTVVIGQVSDPAASGLPAWTRGYSLRREPDGRIFAVGQHDGCFVYVQPYGWKDFKMPAPKGEALNYGVNVPQLHQQMSGTLKTNDPDFGRVALSPQAGTSAPSCPAPSAQASTSARDLLVPGAIVAAALALLLIRPRRPR